MKYYNYSKAFKRMSKTAVVAGLFMAASLPISYADERGLTIWPHLVDGPDLASNDGELYLVNDYCPFFLNTTRNCAKKVWVELRVQWGTLPYPVDVNVDITRDGTFFPAGTPTGTERRVVHIPARTYSTKFAIDLESDRLPEADGSVAIEITGYRITSGTDRYYANGPRFRQGPIGFAIRDDDEVEGDIYIRSYFYNKENNLPISGQVWDSCDQATCTRDFWVHVDTLIDVSAGSRYTNYWPLQYVGMSLPYEITVEARITRHGDFFPGTGAPRTEDISIPLGPDKLTHDFKIPIVLDRMPEANGSVSVEIRRIVRNGHAGGDRLVVDGHRTVAIYPRYPKKTIALIDDDPEFSVGAAEQTVYSTKSADFYFYSNIPVDREYELVVQFDKSGSGTFSSFIERTLTVDSEYAVEVSPGKWRFNQYYPISSSDAGSAITARLVEVRIGGNISRPLTTAERNTHATATIVHDFPRFTIVPTYEFAIAGETAHFNIRSDRLFDGEYTVTVEYSETGSGGFTRQLVIPVTDDNANQISPDWWELATAVEIPNAKPGSIVTRLSRVVDENNVARYLTYAERDVSASLSVRSNFPQFSVGAAEQTVYSTKSAAFYFYSDKPVEREYDLVVQFDKSGSGTFNSFIERTLTVNSEHAVEVSPGKWRFNQYYSISASDAGSSIAARILEIRIGDNIIRPLSTAERDTRATATIVHDFPRFTIVPTYELVHAGETAHFNLQSDRQFDGEYTLTVLYSEAGSGGRNRQLVIPVTDDNAIQISPDRWKLTAAVEIPNTKPGSIVTRIIRIVDENNVVRYLTVTEWDARATVTVNSNFPRFSVVAARESIYSNDAADFRLYSDRPVDREYTLVVEYDKSGRGDFVNTGERTITVNSENAVEITPGNWRFDQFFTVAASDAGDSITARLAAIRTDSSSHRALTSAERNSSATFNVTHDFPRFRIVPAYELYHAGDSAEFHFESDRQFDGEYTLTVHYSETGPDGYTGQLVIPLTDNYANQISPDRWALGTLFSIPNVKPGSIDTRIHSIVDENNAERIRTAQERDGRATVTVTNNFPRFTVVAEHDTVYAGENANFYFTSDRPVNREYSLVVQFDKSGHGNIFDNHEQTVNVSPTGAVEVSPGRWRFSSTLSIATADAGASVVVRFGEIKTDGTMHRKLTWAESVATATVNISDDLPNFDVDAVYELVHVNEWALFYFTSDKALDRAYNLTVQSDKSGNGDFEEYEEHTIAAAPEKSIETSPGTWKFYKYLRIPAADAGSSVSARITGFKLASDVHAPLIPITGNVSSTVPVVHDFPEFRMAAANAEINPGETATFHLEVNQSFEGQRSLILWHNDSHPRDYDSSVFQTISVTFDNATEIETGWWRLTSSLSVTDTEAGTSIRAGFSGIITKFNVERLPTAREWKSGDTITVLGSGNPEPDVAEPNEFIVVAASESVVEGERASFTIVANSQVDHLVEIRINYQFKGDFYGFPRDGEISYTITLRAGTGTENADGTYTVYSGGHRTLDDTVGEIDGSFDIQIKTISENSQQRSLSENESRKVSILVKDNDGGPDLGPNEYIVRASSESVVEGESVSFAIVANSQVDHLVGIFMSYKFEGDFFDFASGHEKTLSITINPGSGVENEDGTFTFDEVEYSTYDDDVGEADGKIDAQITVISESGSLQPLTENESRKVTVLVTDNDGGVPEPVPVLSIHKVFPGPFTEGQRITLGIRASEALDEDYSIRVEILEEGANHVAGQYQPVLVDARGNESDDAYGVVQTVTMKAGDDSALVRVQTVDDDLHEEDGQVYVRIVSRSDADKYTIVGSASPQVEMTIADNDTPGENGSPSEFAARDHYLATCDTVCQSDYQVSLSTQTQSRVNLAFSSSSNLNVQSLVSQVGNSINKGIDLSDIVNMPTFAMPLSGGNEFAGPITMWGGNSKQTLGLNASGQLSIGQLGMDSVIADSYLLGLSVTSSEMSIGNSDGMFEEMNMVQPYLAYSPKGSDIHISAITGLGHGILTMHGLGTADTSRTFTRIGMRGSILSYGNEMFDGNLKLDGKAGISRHTIMDFNKYSGFSSISRHASMALVSNHTVSTPIGKFSPALWTGIDSDDSVYGGGFTYANSHGLTAGAWVNGNQSNWNSPEYNADGIAANVGYSFAATESLTLTPAVSMQFNDSGMSHRFGADVVGDSFTLSGEISDANRLNVNGSIRW